MPGEPHEISRLLGSIESRLNSIEVRAAEDRRTVEARHGENQRALAAVNRETRDAVAASKTAVQEIKEIVQPLSIAVNAMRPTVEAFAISRSKVAAWASVGLVAVTFIGWMVEALVKWAFTALLSHWH